MNMYLTLQNPTTRIQNALKMGWTAILFVALWLGISLSVWAQPQYGFTAVGGTFTPLVGGVDVDAMEADTGTSGNIPIGFTFVYNGTAYTQVRGASDGFLSFNLAATSTLTNNLATTTATRRPLLAPLWDDLDGRTTGAKASYLTSGIAPNRVFTMEWLNWGWNYAFPVPPASISFQVKLYEATGVIEYVYNQEAGAISGTPSASIGLTLTATGANNYFSLNGSGAAPTVSSTIETTTISTKPATGQIYRWTPTFTPIRTLTPADNATLVAPDANLVIGFAYPATAPTIGTGTIELRTNAGVLVESFVLPSSRVTIAGNNITIDPTNVLDCNASYYVTAPATAIAGVGFTALAISTDWNFTTTNACFTVAPADGTTGVATNVSPTITFLFGTAAIGTGTIELRKTTGGTLVESFVLPSSRVTVVGNVVTIDPTVVLDCATDYYLTVPATAVSGVGFSGITATTAWNFVTTSPSVLQTLVSENFTGTTGTTPPTGWSNTTGAASAVIWHFDNPYPRTATGFTAPFAIFDSDDLGTTTIQEEGLLETPSFDASTGTITLEFKQYFYDYTGDANDAGIVEVYNGTTWSAALTQTTSVGSLTVPSVISLDITALTGGSPNAKVRFKYRGTNDWYWIVDDVKITKPLTNLPFTATFTPTNGATGVAQNSNLVVDFDYPVSAGTGNIQIVNATTNAVLETIPVGDARVTISGGQVTINPTTDFPAGVVVAVKFPTGAFKSCNNLDITGITNTTDWRFTVVDPCATLTINAGPNQLQIPSGSTINLAGVAATGGTGSYTYAWTPTTYLSDSTILNPVATNVLGGISYTLTVTDTGTGCTKADGVTITVAAPTGGGGGGGGGTSTVIAPTARITSINSTSLRLNWTGTTGNADRYVIFRKGASSSTFVRVREVASSVSTFLDSMLMPNTEYSYYVQAVRSGATANSNIVSDYTYPSVPTVASFQNACFGSGAQLTIKGSTGVYNVYSSATDGVAIVTGDSTRVITTPTFVEPTKFYISAIGTRYESTPRVAVSVITRPLPTATLLGAVLQESCTETLTIMAEAVEGATYTWYSNDLPVTTTSTPMYTVNRSGIYSVLVNKEGCVARSNSVRVRVNALSPAEIKGLANRQFCETGMLNAVETEGASYEWQRGSVLAGTGSSLEVTESGSYTVTVTSALGCVLTSSSVSVTVISVPQLDLQASASDFCEGSEGVELTVNAVSGATYEWLRNGRKIRTTSTPSLQVNVGAEYAVRVVLNGNCSRTSDFVVITRNAAPAASARVYGDSIKVVYNGNVAIQSVTWTKDDAPFSATSRVFAPTESGIYFATITYETGCEVVSSAVEYIKRPEPPIVSGEEEVEALGFMLFPNPTASKVNVAFGDAFKGDITLTLTDAIGRSIQVVKVKATENAILDLSAVANGTYMLTIASKDKVVTRKIIRE